MRYLIVGVDVGTTSAVAALNLNGEVVGLRSSKDAGVDELVEYIRGLGIPAVVASDVSPPPKALSKISTSVGAQLYAPPQSLSIEEKINLTNAYEFGNSHERDALAAALNTFKKVRNLLFKVDQLGLSESKKYAVLKGDRIKDRLIKKVKEPQKLEVVTKPEKLLTPDEEKIRRLEKQRDFLLGELEGKRKEISSLREELLSHKRGFDAEVAKDKEVSRLKKVLKNRGNEIRKLEDENARFYQFRFLWNKLLDGEILPVGLFPQKSQGLTFMPNKINENEKKHLEGVRLAFTDNKLNRKILGESGVFYSDENYVKRFHGCFYVDSKAIEEAKKLKNLSIEGIVEEYRKKRNQELN